MCKLILVVLACCWAAPLCEAQTSHADQKIEIDVQGVKIKVPDVVLRNQDGQPIRFYSDLIKDKVVVLNFFYANCTYVCARQGKVFSELQSLLGERLGKSVFLISVSTDPVKDNPQQLKAWGARYELQPGWTLVTGDEGEMNKLLIPFTGTKAGGGMHIPATFIANDKKGLWTSSVGIFAPNDLLKAIDSVTK